MKTNRVLIDALKACKTLVPEFADYADEKLFMLEPKSGFFIQKRDDGQR